MKALLLRSIITFVVMLVLADLHAQESGKIRTEVAERTESKEGRKPFRMETTYRGDVKVLQLLKSQKEDKTMSTVRSYQVGNDLILMEVDEDGDGHFESLHVRNPATNHFDVFRRAKDGSVRPVSAEVLALHKELQTLQDEITKVMRGTLDGKIANDQALAEIERRTAAKGADLNRRLRDAEAKDVQ